MWSRGRLVAKVRDGKEEAGAKFADYFDFAEPFTKLPSHRILAMFRGEKEEVLDLTLEPDPEEPADGPTAYERSRSPPRFGIADRGRPADRWLADTVRWAWRTRILVHLGIDLRHAAAAGGRGRGGRGSSPPTCATCCSPPRPAPAPRWASTPGFRTGVKVAVVDATGKVVATDTIYPHVPRQPLGRVARHAGPAGRGAHAST